VPVSSVTLGDTSTSGTVLILGTDAVNTVDVQIAAISGTQAALSQGVSVGALVLKKDTQAALPSDLSGLQRALSGGGGAVRVTNGGGGGGGGFQPGGQPSR